MYRFGAYVCMAFVAAFVVVFWAARGFPTQVRTPIVGQLRAGITSTFGDETDENKRKAAIVEQTQRPEHAKRNDLRLAALQAATAYALSPCEPSFKVELIRSLTDYAKAFSDMRGCSFLSCSDSKVDTAAAAFNSPLDQRTRDALKEAFEQGGITTDEFPAPVRMAATVLASGRGSAQSQCTARTSNTARR